MEAEVTREELSSKPQVYSEEDLAAQAYLSMLWGALAFASMGALSHLAGERCDWQIVAVARTSLAFILSIVIAVVSGVRLVFFKPAILWMRSLVGSVGLLCSFYALTHLPISTALTLTNTFPVWVTLLAWPVLGYRPTPSIWVAIAAGIAGVILIQQPHSSGDKTAGMIALVCAVCTAIAMIGLNRLSSVDSRAVVVHFSGVSTVFSNVFLIISGAVISYGRLGDKTMIALLAGVGLMGTIGQFGMTRAFALGNPSKVAVVGLTQIVFAFIFDLLLWKHHFGATTICGIILVTAPTAWLLMHNPLRRSASIHTTS